MEFLHFGILFPCPKNPRSRAKYQTTRGSPYIQEPPEIIQSSQSEICKNHNKDCCPHFPLFLLSPSFLFGPVLWCTHFSTLWEINYLFNGRHLLTCWFHHIWIIIKPIFENTVRMTQPKPHSIITMSFTNLMSSKRRQLLYKTVQSSCIRC